MTPIHVPAGGGNNSQIQCCLHPGKFRFVITKIVEVQLQLIYSATMRNSLTNLYLMWKLYSFTDLIVFQVRNGSGPQETLFFFCFIWLGFLVIFLIPIMQCCKQYSENKIFEV